MLVDIVAEVRALARARMADVDRHGRRPQARCTSRRCRRAGESASNWETADALPLRSPRATGGGPHRRTIPSPSTRRCAPASHDPVWFLGRQWMRGEHRGRDAASPGLVHLTVTETPVAGRSQRAGGRPADHTARGDHRVRARAVVDPRAARPRRARAAQRRTSAAAPGPAAPARRASARPTTGSTARCSTASRSTASAPRSASPTPCSPLKGCRPPSRPTTGRPASWPTRRPSPPARSHWRSPATTAATSTGTRPPRAGRTRRPPRRHWCARATRRASTTTAGRCRAGGRSRSAATTRAPWPPTALIWQR